VRQPLCRPLQSVTINNQQYYSDAFLIACCQRFPRWPSAVHLAAESVWKRMFKVSNSLQFENEF